jgi:hypothetical protein
MIVSVCVIHQKTVCFRLWPILWPLLHQNDTFSDIQEQQKAFLEAQDACKISAWIVGFRLTIPR